MQRNQNRRNGPAQLVLGAGQAGNQPAQQAINPVARAVAPFMGATPTKLDINKCFGTEAKTIVEEKFAYLIQANKYNHHPSQYDATPYLSFVREHVENQIVSGLATNETIINIGPMFTTQYKSRFYQGASSDRHETIHVMHWTVSWEEKLQTKENYHLLKQHNQFIAAAGGDYQAIARNVCRHGPDMGVCGCMHNGIRLRDNSVITCFDNIHNPDVRNAIHNHLADHPETCAYVAFHDFHQAIETEDYIYSTPDGEMDVEIDAEDGMYVATLRSGKYTIPQKISVMTTHKKAWQYHVEINNQRRSIIYKVIDRYNMGKHDYVLARVVAVGGHYPTSLYAVNNTYVVPIVTNAGAKVIQLFNFARSMYSDVKDSIIAAKQLIYKETQDMAASMAVQHISNWVAKHSVDDLGMVNATAMIYNPTLKLLEATLTIEQADGTLEMRVFTIIPEYLVEAYSNFIARPEHSVFATELRRYMQRWKDTVNERITPDTIGQTVALANILAVRSTTQHMRTVINQEATDLKTMMITGKKTPYNPMKELKRKVMSLTHSLTSLFIRKDALPFWIFMVVLYAIYHFWATAPALESALPLAQAFSVKKSSFRVEDFDLEEWRTPHYDARDLQLHWTQCNWITGIWVYLAKLLVQTTGDYDYVLTIITEYSSIICFIFLALWYVVPNIAAMVLACKTSHNFKWYTKIPGWILTVFMLNSYWVSFTQSLLEAEWLVATGTFVLGVAFISVARRHSWAAVKEYFLTTIIVLILQTVLDNLLSIMFVSAMEGTGKGATTQTPIMLIATAVATVRSYKKRNANLYYPRNEGAKEKVLTTEQRQRRTANIWRKTKGLNTIFIIAILSVLTMPVSARQTTTQIQNTTVVGLMVCIPLFTICLLAMSAYKLTQFTFDNEQSRRWIRANCVNDLRRLEFKELPEEALKKIRIRNPKYNVILTGTGEQIRNEVGCKCHNKDYAAQVGPQLRGTNELPVTIKHPCELVTLAALKRGLECVVQPTEYYAKKIELKFDWMADRILGWIIADGGLKVDVNDWLAEHPEKYRETILRAVNQVENTQQQYVYKIFPKVEMQVTEVTEELLETEKNELKERCIYGPSALKKYHTGPLMKALERLLDKYCPNYCGGKNYTQIAKHFEKWDEQGYSGQFKRSMIDETKVQLGKDSNFRAKNRPHLLSKSLRVIKFYSDMSRYDTTQKERILKSFERMIRKIMTSPHIQWSLEMNPNKIDEFIRHSCEILLYAFQGDVQARVYSRASGDTWTTLANTITSIVLWSVVCSEFGFNEYMDGHREGTLPLWMLFKGDDTAGQLYEIDQDRLNTAIKQGFNQGNTPEPHGVGCIAKMAVFCESHDLDFLSNRMIPRRAGGYRVVRKLQRVLATNHLSTQIQKGRKEQETADELLYSKGMSLLAWGKGLPIYDTLARKMIQLGKPTYKLHVSAREYEHSEKYRTCDDILASDYEDAISWMHGEYGLTRMDILTIERKVDAIQSSADIVVIPELDRVMNCL